MRHCVIGQIALYWQACLIKDYIPLHRNAHSDRYERQVQQRADQALTRIMGLGIFVTIIMMTDLFEYFEIVFRILAEICINVYCLMLGHFNLAQQITIDSAYATLMEKSLICNVCNPHIISSSYLYMSHVQKQTQST